MISNDEHRTNTGAIRTSDEDVHCDLKNKPRGHKVGKDDELSGSRTRFGSIKLYHSRGGILYSHFYDPGFNATNTTDCACRHGQSNDDTV